MTSSKGGPKVDTEPVMVRLPSALIVLIDEFRRDQQNIPSGPEVIRLLLKGHLAALGCIEAEQ
ncbi:hypothetical protein CWS35_19030 [Bradyrhizobium sp. SK17]|jgi:hypothetical protein|nr:hypothetical protein CWS35_19030 [Bradyrhizobium sp. SK17]